MFKALMVVAMIQSTVNQAMSQPGCDFLKIAQAYIATRLPFFDPAGLRPIISDSGDLWELTYELPRGTLGGVPTITIDKRSCTVIRAEHSQ